MFALLATLSAAEASDLGAYEPGDVGHGLIAGSYTRFPTARSWQVSALTTTALMSATTVGLTAWRFDDPNLPVYPWLVTIPTMGIVASSLGSWLVNGQPIGAQIGGASTWVVPATLAGLMAGGIASLILTSMATAERQQLALSTGMVVGSVAYGAVIAWGPTFMAKTTWSRGRYS